MRLKWNEEQLPLFKKENMNIDDKTTTDDPPPPSPIDGAGKEGSSRNLTKADIGPIMIIWSSTANRKRLQDMRAKFRKATKNQWNGVLLHLLPGESIGSMKMLQTQALYEALMQSFDPDLYEIRVKKKIEAERSKDDKIANEIADKLESIQKEAKFQENFDTVANLTANM